MHNNGFDTLLQDLAAVFTASDSLGLLQQSVLPVNFHESNPDDIVRAYEAYIAENANDKLTSVSEKLSGSGYSSPYDLYHDVKLACGSEIVKHEVGSERYQEIDSFYRICIDLLLREVASLGLQVIHEKDRVEQEDNDDLLEVFRDDFENISLTHFESNGEFITYINKYTEPVVPTYHSAYNSQSDTETKTIVQPLFSSLVGRSVLDPRNTVVPEPWLLTKAVGQGLNPAASGTIKSFNSVSCKIPLPSQASAQVLDSFFHPNWYTIESPKWLQYKQKTFKPPLISTLVKNGEANELRVLEKKSNIVSLGPVVDLRNSVLSDDLKRKIWYSSVGYKQVEEIHRKRLTGEISEVEGDVQVEASLENEQASGETVAEDIPADKEEADGPGEKTASETSEIKLENLVRFDPEATLSLQQLRKDKAKIVKSPQEIQKVISLNLLRLNKLRQERFLHSTSPATPSLQETLVYNRVVKLLSILAKSNVAMNKSLLLQLSKKIPVLMNDYQGVLPGPMPTKPMPTNKSGRLPGIKGTHKKKGRFA